MEPLNTALTHLQAGRLEEAKEIAAGVLEKAPSSVLALRILADVAGQGGDSAAAAVLLERAAKFAPTDPNLLLDMGQVYRSLARFDDALACYGQLGTKYPKVADIQTKLGLAHYERAAHVFDGFPAGNGAQDFQSDLTAAMSHFERALVLEPKEPLPWRGLAHCYLGLNDVFKASLRTVDYVRRRPEDEKFAANFPDLTTRMMLAKGLREQPESVARNATGVNRPGIRAAIASIREQLPAEILGPAIVFYHVDIGGSHPYLTGSVELSNQIDYLATLAGAVHCARQTQPGATIVLLTDEKTAIDRLDLADHIVRIPRSPDHLMYARLCAYQALTMSGRLKGPALFLDTDLCLTRDFAPLFDGSFDIGLAHRSSITFPLMPINEGLILADARRLEPVVHFFDECLTLYEWLANHESVKQRYPFDIRYWRGGQLSLAAFVRWTVPPHSAEVAEIDTVRCRFLHCRNYNRSVGPNDQLPDMQDVWALHFKGLSKDKLGAYLKSAKLS